MERNLKSHPNYPLIMREFLLGLNQWIGDSKAFLWAMRESQGTDVEMALDRQNSLLHLLLKVPVLHSKIMELLLDKLLEAAHMDELVFSLAQTSCGIIVLMAVGLYVFYAS